MGFIGSSTAHGDSGGDSSRSSSSSSGSRRSLIGGHRGVEVSKTRGLRRSRASRAHLLLGSLERVGLVVLVRRSRGERVRLALLSVVSVVSTVVRVLVKLLLLRVVLAGVVLAMVVHGSSSDGCNTKPDFRRCRTVASSSHSSISRCRPSTDARPASTRPSNLEHFRPCALKARAALPATSARGTVHRVSSGSAIRRQSILLPVAPTEAGRLAGTATLPLLAAEDEEADEREGSESANDATGDRAGVGGG